MKKLIVSLLSVLLLGSIVIGCTTDPNTTTPVGTTDTQTQIQEETTELDTSIKDGVPEGLTFDGLSIVTAYREDGGNDIYYIGEPEGDVMSAALYKANMLVNERLDINRTFIPLVNAELTNKIVTSILSDEPYYDYVPVNQFYGTQYCAQGIYLDLSSLPYIDFSSPWYYSEYMDSLSIGKGTCFFIAGDIFPIISAWTQATFWNKTLYRDLISDDLMSLYNLVDDGDWTFAKMQEMCTTAYADLDKDNTVSAGDRFGAVNSEYGADHFAYSMGLRLTERNDDGFFDLVVDTERNNDIVEKIQDLFTNNVGFKLWTASLGSTYTDEKFAADELLFYQSGFVNVLGQTIRAMKSEYGVIPYPKFDETQEKYIATVHNSAFFVSVPINTPTAKLDAIAATIEAQGYQNWLDYTPVFFEEALKIKFNRDEENADTAAKMIDLIRDSLSVDFAYIYSNNCNDLGRITASCMQTKKTLTQNYNSRIDNIEQGLEELFDAFASLGKDE